MLVEKTSLRSAKVSMKTTDGAVFSKMAILLDSSSLKAADACMVERRGEAYATEARRVRRVTESFAWRSWAGDGGLSFSKLTDGCRAASHVVVFEPTG
jgi:hypothetical protein